MNEWMTHLRPTPRSAAATGLLQGLIGAGYESVRGLAPFQTLAGGEALWIVGVAFNIALVSLFVIGIQEAFKRRNVPDQDPVEKKRQNQETTTRMWVWILAAGLSMVVTQPLLSLALR